MATTPGEQPGPGHAHSSGLLLLTTANAVYIAGGYVLTVALARMLGREEFGSYGVVAGFITVINMLITRGVPIAAAREVAARPREVGIVLASSRSLMVPLSAGLFGVGVVVAWPLAALLGDTSLAPAMAIGAGAALSFGFQSQLFAWANGMQRYWRQAWGQMVYGLGRVVTIVGGAAAFGLPGAIAGFVVGPLLGALPLLARRPRGAVDSAERTALARAARPIVISTTGVTLLMIVDLFAFKRVATHADVGIYTAAATLAHVPFFLLQAASFVLLPAVAAAAVGAERRRVVVKGVSDTIVLLAIPTAILVAVGDRALSMIYGGEFHPGGAVVGPLAIATAGVALHGAFVSIDAAMGRLRETVVLGMGTVVVLAGAVSLAGRGSDLPRAALAVGVVCVALAFVHAARVHTRVGALVAPRAFVAVGLATLLAGALRLLPDTPLAVFGGALVAGCAYLALVIATRVLDIRRTPAPAEAA